MRRILRLAMHLFPRSFRLMYGDELVDHLLKQGWDVHRRAGLVSLFGMCISQAFDLFRSAWSERRTTFQANRRSPDGVWQDARFACRALRKNPAVTFAGIATLGLGIGALTTMFSVLDAVVLNPLPYDQSAELVSVSHVAEGMDGSVLAQSAATYRTYLAENRVFEALGVWSRTQLTISTEGTEPEQLEAVWMTPDVFRVLRVAPHLGTPYPEVDLEPGVTLPAVISHEFWRRRFGADPDVIGKSFQQENVTWEICGVMPEGFTFLDTRPSVYLPTFLPPETSPIVGKFDYQGIARLRPGVATEEANADVNRMIPLTVERFGWTSASELDEMRLRAEVHLLADDVVGHIRTSLWILFGTFGIVLLVAASNTANLILLGTDRRQQEIALRSAIGASRGRIVRQIMCESVLVALAGGALGTLLAYQGTRLLTFLAPTDLPNLAQISVSHSVLLFALALSVLSGVVCGLFPGLGYSRPDLVTSLKEASRSGGGGRRRTRARDVLAVVQVSMALVLVIGSVLLSRSFLALRAVDPGFRAAEEVVAFSVTVPVLDHYLDADGTVGLMATFSERLAALPGVSGASAVSSLPVEDRSDAKGVLVKGPAVDPTRPQPLRRYKMVLPDYFRTMGIQVLAGRDLAWNDVRSRNPVALVTEGFAVEFWGGADGALGKEVRFEPEDRPHRIIGVVGDVLEAGLDRPAPPMVFFPMAAQELAGISDWVRRSMTFVVRTPGMDPTSLVPQFRAQLSSLKPGVPVANIRVLDRVVAKDMARTTFTLVLLGLGAGVAMLLGAVGIYGVVSYVFERRTRELGVRMALGATRADVGGLVLRHAGALAGVGIAVGLAFAVGLTGLLESLLFGVTRTDLPTYLAASALVTLTVLVASLAPAWKAVSVDTVQAMRSE